MPAIGWEADTKGRQSQSQCQSQSKLREKGKRRQWQNAFCYALSFPRIQAEKRVACSSTWTQIISIPILGLDGWRYPYVFIYIYFFSRFIRQNHSLRPAKGHCLLFCPFFCFGYLLKLSILHFTTLSRLLYSLLLPIPNHIYSPIYVYIILHRHVPFVDLPLWSCVCAVDCPDRAVAQKPSDRADDNDLADVPNSPHPCATVVQLLLQLLIILLLRQLLLLRCLCQMCSVVAHRRQSHC